MIIFIPNDGEVQKLSDLHLKSHTHNQALQYKKVLTAQGQYLKRHVLQTVGRKTEFALFMFIFNCILSALIFRVLIKFTDVNAFFN